MQICHRCSYGSDWRCINQVPLSQQDVEVVLLDIPTLCPDESFEEEFWADDSDTDDDDSVDTDPELKAERWDCLTCRLKNKPFLRYCGKCWQVNPLTA